MTDDPGPDVEVAGLARWLPLDLAQDPQQLRTDVQRRFAATTDPTMLEVLTGMLLEVVEGYRVTAETELASGTRTVGLWALLEDEDRLAPLTWATLRLLEHKGDDPLGLLAELVEGTELWETPELHTVQTASGPATGTRYRPVVGTADGQEVHEQALVMWLRPERGWAAVLSTYTTDLVAAVEVPHRLDQLAAGVRGL